MKILCNLLIAGLIAVFVPACGLKKRQPEQAAPEPPTEDVLKTSIHPLKEVNRYGVELSWDTGVNPERWILYRCKEGEDPVQITVISGSQETYFDHTLNSGGTYLYLLKYEKDGKVFDWADVVAQVPTDLIIEGKKPLSGEIKTARLFLSAGSEVVTWGKDLKIIADEIISNNGIIESFPEGTIADAGLTGRNGGTITLLANGASGYLKINARGEHGGLRSTGKSGYQGSKGERGEDVKCDFYHTVFAVLDDKVLSHEVILDGEKIPTVEDVINNHRMTLKLLKRSPEEIKVYIRKVHRQYAGEKPMTPIGFSKDRQLGNGKPGRIGGGGGRGGDGLRGGDSASVFLSISDPKKFKVDVISEVGRGGPGGVGGLGGRGGEGGETGSLPPNCQDHYADTLNIAPIPGPRGEDGTQGPSGKQGPDGAKMPVIINRTQPE